MVDAGIKSAHQVLRTSCIRRGPGGTVGPVWSNCRVVTGISAKVGVGQKGTVTVKHPRADKSRGSDYSQILRGKGVEY